MNKIVKKKKCCGLDWFLEQNRILLAFALTQSGVPLSLLFSKQECKYFKKQFKTYKLNKDLRKE